MEKISYAQLLEKLGDPDVPMSDLDAYLVYDVSPKMGSEIRILPNSETVDDESDSESINFRTRGDLGLGFLNSIFRRRRKKRFNRRHKAFKEHGQAGETFQILLSEGDSWFQYPRWLEDTIDWLLKDFDIYSLGAAGDTLRNMLRKSEYWDRLEKLHEDGIVVNALLFSAGGNDIVGPALKDMLRDFTPGSSAQDLLIEPIVDAKFQQLIFDYEHIFERLKLTDSFKDLPVLFHGYSHAIPRPDQGFKIPPLDGWLGDPMRERGIQDLAIQREIVTILMDRINAEFSGLADRFTNAVFVDNRGVFGDDLWHDELHPKNEGFRRVAENFKSHLSAIGIEPQKPDWGG